MEKKFNQKEYINEYKKNNYKQINIKLKNKEKEELDLFLKQHKISYTDFLRESFRKLKEEYKMKNEIINKYLEKYEIDSIDEFEPKFYIRNLVNGHEIELRAIKNLLNNYSKEELIQIENYDEIGIVEYVANNDFFIENNKIVPGCEYNEDDYL